MTWSGGHQREKKFIEAAEIRAEEGWNEDYEFGGPSMLATARNRKRKPHSG
jgi:hypothetical protein